MNRMSEAVSFAAYVIRKFMALGTRTLMGCAAALISAVLIFSAPAVGLLGVAGGVGIGVISAVLIGPHFHSSGKSSSRVHP